MHKHVSARICTDTHAQTHAHTLAHTHTCASTQTNDKNEISVLENWADFIGETTKKHE